MAARLSLLDPLRGFAALMVVLFHARLLLVPQWLDAVAATTQVIENSYLWVDLFFIMSGLVMAHVYAEALARREIRVRRFLWLRLTRIYPLYLLTLLIAIGWELYKHVHQIGFYAGPLFRKWGLEGAPAFASRFTPYEALPSTFVLLQTPAGYGLTWNYVLLVWCAASQVARSSPGFRLLQNRLTNQLGDLSYSIYLWHGVLLLGGVQLLHVLAPQRVERWYADTRPLAGALAVLALLALVWGVSWPTYHYIERPARRRLRQLFPA